MISFSYELDFELVNEPLYSNWIADILKSEEKELGELSYIFCDDEYLLSINQQYLQHDYYTDIISFDYSEDNIISGDVFISIDRVRDNAANYNVTFTEELLRVMSHGVLHFCGYKDKTEAQQLLMRNKEEEKMTMFHVKQ